MNLISHKLPHEPIHSYMVNGYVPDNPEASVYIHPTECRLTDKDGDCVEEYVFGTDGLTHGLYWTDRKAIQCYAVYSFERSSNKAYSVMFSMNTSNLEEFDESIRMILDDFDTIDSLKVDEDKIYVELKPSYGRKRLKLIVRRLG